VSGNHDPNFSRFCDTGNAQVLYFYLMASDMPAMLSIAAGKINEVAKYDSSEMRNREVGGKKNATGSKKKQVTFSIRSSLKWLYVVYQ
jgi:hypothetical protein